jgi:hypothetical protein
VLVVQDEALFEFRTWKVRGDKKLKYWATMTCKYTIYLFLNNFNKHLKLWYQKETQIGTYQKDKIQYFEKIVDLHDCIDLLNNRNVFMFTLNVLTLKMVRLCV